MNARSAVPYLETNQALFESAASSHQVPAALKEGESAAGAGQTADGSENPVPDRSGCTRYSQQRRERRSCRTVIRRGPVLGGSEPSGRDRAS